MKQLTPLLLAALPLAATFSCNAPEASDGPSASAMAAMEMSEAEMMQKMMEMGMPGEPHQKLASHAGNWNVTMSMRMGPEEPWQDSQGTSSIKMTLGGRYMAEQTNFEMMGMESNGILFVGYDNLSQCYQSVWMDSWGTRMMIAEGKEVEPGVVEYRGTMKDFVTPEGRPYMYRVTDHSADHVVMEMYDTIPDSPEAPMPSEPNVMVMKMEYKRAAE